MATENIIQFIGDVPALVADAVVRKEERVKLFESDILVLAAQIHRFALRGDILDGRYSWDGEAKVKEGLRGRAKLVIACDGNFNKINLSVEQRTVCGIYIFNGFNLIRGLTIQKEPDPKKQEMKLTVKVSTASSLLDEAPQNTRMIDNCLDLASWQQLMQELETAKIKTIECTPIPAPCSTD